MAALCTGNYGLSQNCTDNSKEYFFVKLTDSAYRAVEEYQRNQSKCNTHATIQILGNGGVLSFPSLGGNMGQQFRFSIDDIEGSFECIQQTQNQLSVLGALPYKMRIHANDDVYETTRHRMAVAEENQKNKCTREIKPNQTDIGRKVKLKTASGRLPNIPPKRDQLLTNTSQSPLSSSVSTLNSMSSNNPLSSGTSSTISPPLSTSLSSTTSSSISSSSLQSNLLIGGGGSIISSSGTTTGILPATNTTISSSLSSSSSNNNNNHNNINNNNSNSNSSNNSSSLKNSNSNNSINNSLSNTNINCCSSLKQHHHHNHHHHFNSTTNSGGVGGGGGVSAASSLSSVLSSAAGSGTSGINSYFSNNNISNNNSGLRTNGLGNNSSSGSRRGVQGNGGPIGGNRNQRNGSSRHTPDITKKKIRERLIHLLALKPFKKPELYARLQNEGIREREKNLISGILKDISTMRDNTYNLKRQIWNDVNEDWPFYSEQELQMLKRRKPQNLTPPLSSDGGSSTSGQSPTSTHNGSPPPAVKRPSLDRDRFYEEPTAKKQRISHFRKESNEINRWSRRSGVTDSRDSSNMNPRSRENHEIRSSNYYGSNIIPSKQQHQQQQHHEPEDNAMSISYSVLGSEAARRISPREDVMNGHSNNNHHISSSHHQNTNIIINNNNNNKNTSNNNGNNNNGHHQSPTSYNLCNNNVMNNSSSHLNGNSSNNNNNNNIINNINSNSTDSRRKSSSPMTTSMIGNTNAGIGASSPGAGSRTSNNNSNINNSSSTMSGGIADRGSAIIANNNVLNNINQGSNSSRNLNMNINNNCNNNNNNNNNHNLNNNNNNNGGPLTKTSYDFSQFTKIKSIEQRRLYKNEFENDYHEYRQLLNKIESVRKRFNMLAEKLDNAKNNTANYKVISRQILSEYERINSEQEHKRAKARFDYLHAKLAHIKALVSEFDKTITGQNTGDNRKISSASPLQNISGTNSILNGSNGNGGGGGGGGIITNCVSPSQNVRISPGRNGGLSSMSPPSSSSVIGSGLSSTNSHHHLPKQENY